MNKRIIAVFFVITCFFSASFAEQIKNLIVVSYGENLTASENAWLPASVKDELESNLQTYTKYSFVSSSENKIKELQKKSESSGFDESSAIELGKLTSASHAVFVTTRKAGPSYTVTAELTNLTTGKVIAKCVSSAKAKAELVANINGSSVDEVTIELCQKLGVTLTNSQKYLLQNGTLEISDKEQIAVYNQELANFNKQIANFDAEIAKLMNSNSLDSLTKKQKLESERALAEEKKKAAEANKTRLAEIEKAKKEEEAANAGRTAEQQKKILEVSKAVNEKAAELKKLQTENLTALGKIKLIESKKATLIDIRNNVNKEQKEVPARYKKEYDAKIAAVNDAPWRTAEKNEDGKPAPEAVQARKEKVKIIETERNNLVSDEQQKIAEATYESQVAIIADILLDKKNLLEQKYYATNLNNSLRVSIGNYSRSNDGWKVRYAILCDGIELGSSEGIIKYSSLESFIPSGMEKFDAVDMYDSLFKCGEPVLSFQIAYSVIEIEEISKYKFSFSKLEYFNTNDVDVDAASGKLKSGKKSIGIDSLAGDSFTKVREIKPGNEWMKKYDSLDNFDELYKRSIARMEVNITNAKKGAVQKEDGKQKSPDFVNQYLNNVLNEMVKIPAKNILILPTEVTQAFYKSVIGVNPSYNKGDNNPVECVSWYDAVCFCNLLSEMYGLQPVYSINKQTDVKQWHYTPNKTNDFKGKVVQNKSANGFRLPSEEEWEFAARGGLNYKYSGSNNADDVAWFYNNSENKTHPVALKKSNGNGLYDMSGNVWELCWGDNNAGRELGIRGGCYSNRESNCEVTGKSSNGSNSRNTNLGFRIVCNID